MEIAYIFNSHKTPDVRLCFAVMRCTNCSRLKQALIRDSKFQKLVANIRAEQIIGSNKECQTSERYLRHA